MIYHVYLDTLKVDLRVYDIMQCLKAAAEKKLLWTTNKQYSKKFSC